jgi:hypothetical protein
MSQVTLTDANGTLYTFPLDFFVKTHDWEVRSGVSERAYAHGGRDTGDGYLKSRIITVEGALRDDTLAGLDTKLLALRRAVLKGGDLRVTDDTVSRYIRVRAPKASEQFIGDYRNERPIVISFLAEDVFWKDDTETTVTKVAAAAIEDFTADATGSHALIYPVIQIVADQGVDVPSVSLKNLSDGGMSLVYADQFFVQGDTVTIDCGEGTVTRNNNDTISAMTTARFLRLQPGVNDLRYEGAAATVKVKFRKVYL